MKQLPVVIRRGVPADAEELARFASRTFVDTYGSMNRPEDLQAHLESKFGVTQQSEELSDPETTILLAHSGETLVAFAQIRRSPPPSCVTELRVAEASTLELHRFYVDRPAHGLGVAQGLMAASFASARELGGGRLWLSVWERNPRALAFYKKMAFMEVGQTVFQVGSDEQTDHVLVVDLLRVG